MRSIISAIIAYIGTRFVFSIFGFEYDIFSDPFNLWKFAIDIGGFAAIFFAAYFLLGMILPAGNINETSSDG